MISPVRAKVTAPKREAQGDTDARARRDGHRDRDSDRDRDRKREEGHIQRRLSRTQICANHLAVRKGVRKFDGPNASPGAHVNTSPGILQRREEQAVAERDAEQVVLQV